MSLLVRLRVLLARHPSVYWLVVTVLAVHTVGAVDDRLDQLDAERRSWGSARTVWVASTDHGPGDAVTAEQRTVPLVAVPADAVLVAPVGIVVQRVGKGEILTSADIGDDRLAMLPVDTVGVAVGLGDPPLDLEPGDHAGIVDVTGVLVDDALVLSVVDGTAVVAVPEEVSGAVAMASQQQTVALTLRRP